MTDLMPLSEARLLDAKRYGLSEKQITAFMDILQSVERPGEVEGEADETTSETNAGDLIRDYILQRMSNRMNMEDAFTQNAQANPYDMMMDLIGKPREKSSNLSGLLNMHFDLNTLQMLNQT